MGYLFFFGSIWFSLIVSSCQSSSQDPGWKTGTSHEICGTEGWLVSLNVYWSFTQVNLGTSCGSGYGTSLLGPCRLGPFLLSYFNQCPLSNSCSSSCFPTTFRVELIRISVYKRGFKIWNSVTNVIKT